MNCREMLHATECQLKLTTATVIAKPVAPDPPVSLQDDRMLSASWSSP